MRKLYMTAFYKKVVPVFLVLLSFAQSVFAQTDVVVGTGTAGGSTNVFVATSTTTNRYSYNYTIYTAADIIAAGGFPGMISKLAWQKGGTGEYTVNDATFKVYLKPVSFSQQTTTLETWASVIAGATPVFSSTAFGWPTGTGFKEITLQTPYNWDGVSNIAVLVDWYRPGTMSTDMTWLYTTVTNANKWRIGTAPITDMNQVNSSRANIRFSITPATVCSGTPTPGTAVSDLTNVCSSTQAINLTVTGSTVASGLTYQWESSTDGGTTWNPISGATNASYTSPGIGTTTQFRRRITCGASSSNSTIATVTITAAAYTTLPFTESFEASWLDVCNTRDVPNNFWRNIPATGNNSWRRHDDGVASAGWTSNSGLYTPNFSTDAYSARFHSFNASSGTKGQLLLHVNCNTPLATKELAFDYINTSGSDSLVISVSTDGGATFVRSDSVRISTVWKTKIIYFNSTSATTIIRFEGVSDFGSTDIGLDNVRVRELPVCTGTPVGGTIVASATNVCLSTQPISFSITGSTPPASGLSYQWESSTDGGTTWNPIPGATGETYTTPGISTTTQFRRKTICATTTSTNSTVATVTILAPAYGNLPFTESFETTWLNNCDTRDIPNNFWRSSPATGNNSWRRHDDPTAAAWGNPTLGLYTPNFSTGAFSARFHSYQASSGTRGNMILHVNCNTTLATKELAFDYINTSGSDSLVVSISTDGGITFVREDSVRISTVWKTKIIYFTSSSPTTVIRFEAFSDFGTTDIGLDNVRIRELPVCTGTPVGGTITASTTSVCTPTQPISFTITGSTTPATGISYQWQRSTDGGTTWIDIPGATDEAYTSTGVSVTTQFRRKINCFTTSSNSTVATVTVQAPAYTTLPFTESFENTWASVCDTRDVPNNFWRNTPGTGNNSWRRHDDGVATANWTSNSGLYTPNFSTGAYSARFHSFNASNGTKGQFDLYVNMNTGVASKALSFDYINLSGSDSLVISISTNGGTSFTRLDSVRISTVWKTKTIFFNATSATSVIRFEGVSDFGSTDIGLDNVRLADFPPCAGTPVGGTTVSTQISVCNSSTPFTLSVTGDTYAANLTYQWQSSTDGGATWNPITGATAATYTSTGIAASTQFRRLITCSGNTSNSTALLISFTAPQYTTLPFNESFETTWADICGIKDVPNNFWRNDPFTGNNSWRRDDDGATAAWTNPGDGLYDPIASAGVHSARFHSDQATSGTRGKFDLFINGNTGFANKRLSFDYINTTGSDSLVVSFSTNGGTSFTRIDSVRLTAIWKNKAVFFNSTSATTVIRFEAYSDNGTTDIGLDNINIVDWVDCSGTPTGGTAVSSVTNSCVEPFTLSTTGSTTGNGITYQWQRSTDGGTTWANIPGATNMTLTTTQVGTTQYRLVVNCTLSSQSANSTAVTVTSPTPVSGTFTINNSVATGGTNFNTFNEAYQYLRCGINGPVVFNVQTGTGPYNEQLIMTAIPGASAVNTVTFKGNGVAAITYNSTVSTDRAVIKLKGTKHIVLDSLVINASTGTYGYGVQLMSKTDSNTVKSCIINLPLTGSSTNFAGIVLSGSDADAIATGTVLSNYNNFAGNTINGGYYGITLTATFAGGGNGNNKITGNTISNFYQHGIYVMGSFGTLIEKNVISRPTRSEVGAFYGIYFVTQKNAGCFVSKNRISNPFGGALTSTADFYGINFNASDGSTGNPEYNENTVSNNLIYNVNGNGLAYGIANTSSDYAYYFHNTISLDNAISTATAATRGFFQTTAAAGLIFYNNIISVTRGGTGTKHAIYLGANLLVAADNNDYYVNAAGGTSAVGYYQSDRVLISNWVAATGMEQASLSAIPAYVDPANGNFTPGNAGINNKGLPVGITSDILDVVRDPATPDMGAYEFTPPPCGIPVNGFALTNPDTTCQNTPVFLSLNIGPYGSGQTFQWQTAPNATGPFINLGSPMLSADTTIIANVTTFLRVAINCGSTTVYSDTVHLVVNPALPGGSYTINKGQPASYVPGVPGGNFISFAAAKAAMGCGITGGPVVFNVVTGSGPYNEQFKLNAIAGVTVVNNITFNGNGNTITFNSTTTDERAVIKLDGAKHIIFDSLVVVAGAGTYGYGVQLINNADSNTFRRNTIIAGGAHSSTDFAGVVINSSNSAAITSGATLSDANTFDRNTISGGYYGITLVGSTTAASFIQNNRIINNTIKNFYNYGIYAVGTLNTIIEGNTFSRPDSTTAATSIYGIYLTSGASNKLRVSKNRFFNIFGAAPAATSTFYGVYHNVDVVEDTVSNNLFYKLNGNGPIYALYNSSADNVLYYHNTISMDNELSAATGVTVGFYQTTAAEGIEFKNNLITLTRGGTGKKHAIYRNTATSTIAADYNNYYVNAPNAFTGYSGGDRLTLADLVAASGGDAHSLATNPLYTDSANGNFRPQIALLENKGTPVGIGTDITNQVRSTTTPDIGAYEFAPAPCATPLIAGTATVTPSSGVCLEQPVTLNVTGHSPLGSITFQWQSSPNGTSGWTNLSGVQYFPKYDTLTSVNTYYRAEVKCGTQTVYTNVVQINLNPLLLAGTYTINSADPATYVPGVAGGNFQSFTTAVNALLCGITGPVVFNVHAGTNGTYNEQIRIPYIPGTSTVNSVTFQSATGVASSANLSFAGTATNNYTLRLDSTRNFRFKNLTFTATNAAFGRAVEFFNNASYDSLTGCIITTPVVTATSNVTAGVYANPVRGTNLVIKGNTITNGANGIYFSGTSATALAGLNNVIDSNTVSGAYSHGIFVQYANRIQVNKNKVTLSGDPAATTAGIYANYMDSVSKLSANTVLIDNVTSANVYGIYVANTRASISPDSMLVSSNKVIAGTGNTGTVYGLAVTASKGVSVVNNVIALNNAGATAYGLYNLNNAGDINYYNNSVNMLATSTNGYAGYFTQTATARLNVRNNIFSNKGGGRALFVNNPALFSADYNMLHTTGASLVQVATGTILNFANLKDWTQSWNWDRYSIGYAPVFENNTDLRPDLNNADVWAMHGRGVQIKGNGFDFNNNPRPEIRTAGVPDMGAYEFFPIAQPTVLLASPATPVTGQTQTFTYGTDTVMRIKWTGTAPASVSVKRFSGVVPTGLLPGTDSMYFYTKVEIPGGGNFNYEAKLYYVESWLGSIPQQNRLGLGRTTASNAWVVGANSRVNVAKKEISQDAIIYLDRFTGMINPFAQPESEDSSSNRGKDFWVGYQRTNGFTGSNGGLQVMKIYMGAGEVDARVTITIEGTSGTPWVRTYTVPANTALTSDDIPKFGTDDARLENEGKYEKRGIHITSDVPIVAYAHIYESTNSGATMLMPSAVWGYEYYTLSSRQNYTSTSYAAFHVVAQHDSTWIEINPSKPTRGGWVPNGGTQPNGSYLVKLNKGDAYQVLGEIQSGAEGYDLSGSYVKSISNGQSECHPIAVFAGSTRTGIGCGTAAGSTGDLIIQQIFPYQAWGSKYATAPTSIATGPNAGSNMTNTFRIMVKDPTTVVKRNNVQIPLASLINSKYYQYESNTADYIEANKPVLVAQFMSSSGSCPNTGGNGDPEMFYLSPVEQAIKQTQFYRNSLDDIDENFITLVIPTEGLTTLKIDGINYQAYPAAEVYSYDHPNLPGYSIVSKKWTSGPGSSTAESELPFTGIVYGLGNVESYGYNIGTLVKNLNNLSSVNTEFNSGSNPTEYTCKGAPFEVTILLPIQPTQIVWQFSQVPRLSPNVDSVQTNPVPTGTVVVNGVTYYAYTVNQSFVLDTAGIITIPVQYSSPLIEKCNQTELGKVIIQVLPPPITDFAIAYPGGGTAACEGATLTFTGDLITGNGIALNQWNWTFHNGSTPTGQVQTFTYPVAGTYPVKLKGVTADGCISDTTKQIVINAKPVVTVVTDSIAICAGQPVTFTISNPITGAVYNWYDAPTGGNLLATGTSFTPTNVTPPAYFYAEAVSSTSCISAVRKKVTVSVLPALTPAVVTVTSEPNSITFTWTAVPGAASYQISTDGGTSFVTPSSGPTGLTHTINGLAPSTSVTLIVKAIGTITCQTSLSQPVTGRTLLDQIFIPNSFTPNGDARNDDFRIYGYTIKEMKVAIFNQWGEKITETNNPSRDGSGGHLIWDGRHKGTIQPSGVYFWVARIVTLEGEVIEKKGSINLIR